MRLNYRQIIKLYTRLAIRAVSWRPSMVALLVWGCGLDHVADFCVSAIGDAPHARTPGRRAAIGRWLVSAIGAYSSPHWWNPGRWLLWPAQKFCGWTTGHDRIGDTGYGGGGRADTWCYWCDHFSRRAIPRDETTIPSDLMDEVDHTTDSR